MNTKNIILFFSKRAVLTFQVRTKSWQKDDQYCVNCAAAEQNTMVRRTQIQSPLKDDSRHLLCVMGTQTHVQVYL